MARHLRVDLITTDGFLQPNAELEERGLLGRKGFPESYRQGALVEFLRQVVNGAPQVSAPIYSHVTYDITDEVQLVEQPDILIVEGLNVLQTGSPSNTPFVSDYFDFTIYVDADTEDLESWYVERFQQLRSTAFREQSAYFSQFAHLPVDAAEAVARTIWRSINLVNLQENILPTRARADLVLKKPPTMKYSRFNSDDLIAILEVKIARLRQLQYCRRSCTACFVPSLTAAQLRTQSTKMSIVLHLWTFCQ